MQLRATKQFFVKLLVVTCVWTVIFVIVLRTYNDTTPSTSTHSDALSIRTEQAGEITLSESEKDSPQSASKAPLGATNDKLPYLPVDYWLRHAHLRLQLNDTCAPFPETHRLDFFSKYWQSFDNTNNINNSTENGTVSYKLYGAYYDRRASVSPDRAVRLLAMIDRIDAELPPSYCQLWFEQRSAPVIVPVAQHKLIWYKTWGAYDTFSYPYLLSCVLPEHVRTLVPQAVSLVARECHRATNSLRVLYEPRPPDVEAGLRFAVCTKGLNFPHVDVSLRLIEWFELMRLLGAHKIYAFRLDVHRNVSRVLDYYARRGYLEVRPQTVVPNEVRPQTVVPQRKLFLLHKRLNEVVPYNDCFYRNMYRYDYIANVDVDEVIMPVGERRSWQDLVDVAQTAPEYANRNCTHGYASICFRHVFFPDANEDPVLAQQSTALSYRPLAPFHMLRHTWRVAEHTNKEYATKCLHNTTEALTVHNHYSLAWLKSCKPLSLDPSHAQLNHYRALDPPPIDSAQLVEDRSVWRFEKELRANVRRVINDLELGTYEHEQMAKQLATMAKK